MTTYVFHSTDTGLPQAGVDGIAGAGIANILDPCLVNGFNSKSGVTVTRSGGTATYTYNNHGYAALSVVTIGGFNETDYNVTGTITNVTANTWDMTVANSPATPGTGTGTSIKAPIGWSTTFTGTNIRSYKQKSGTNQLTLGVDDTSTSNLNVRLFESMTAAGTTFSSGVNPTPSQAQNAGGLYCYKSSVGAGTYRNWQMFSNGKIFYLFIQFQGVTTSGSGMAFGDFTSYRYGDAYNTCLIASIAINAGGANQNFWNGPSTGVPANASMSGHYIARPFTGIGGSYNCYKWWDATRACTAVTIEPGAAGGAYPSPTEGGIILSPMWIFEGNNGRRGHLPGMWVPCHNRALTHGDTFTGQAGSSLAGKTFEVVNGGSGAQLVIETSDTWS